MEKTKAQLVGKAGLEEEALPVPGSCGHTLMSVTSVRATEFIDITDPVNALIAASGVSLGIVNVQALHTTTAIILNEHEPLLLADFEEALDRAAPVRAAYLHDQPGLRTVNLVPNERTNGHSHCQALLLGASVSVNIVDGRLLLGRWQRLFFVDLDGPRERILSAMILGDGDPRR